MRELAGGTSNVHFDHRVTAIRRKYETVRFADHTNDPDPTKMREAMRRAKTESGPEFKLGGGSRLRTTVAQSATK